MEKKANDKLNDDTEKTRRQHELREKKAHTQIRTHAQHIHTTALIQIFISYVRHEHRPTQ